MTTMTTVVGIDIAKAKFDAAFEHGHTGTFEHGTFDNTAKGFKQLTNWLKRHRVEQVHACLEATGTYGDALAEFLHEAGHVVSVVNPAQIKAYADSRLSRTKTDKTDAILLARYCRSETPMLWTPPPPELRDLRALLHQLDALKDMRQQEHNRLSALSTQVQSSQVRDMIQTHIDFLDEQIKHLTDSIKGHVTRHPHLQHQRDLLQSIPGIAWLTAARLIAADITRFDSADQLAAYAGLSPHQHRSGSSVNKPAHLSKRGHATLRHALYMPAIVATKHNPLIHSLYHRLLGKGKAKMQAIGAAMHKLLRLAFGVLKSDTHFDARWDANRLQVP
jgi:transposase